MANVYPARILRFQQLKNSRQANLVYGMRLCSFQAAQHHEPRIENRHQVLRLDDGGFDVYELLQPFGRSAIPIRAQMQRSSSTERRHGWRLDPAENLLGWGAQRFSLELQEFEAISNFTNHACGQERVEAKRARVHKHRSRFLSFPLRPDSA